MKKIILIGMLLFTIVLVGCNANNMGIQDNEMKLDEKDTDKIEEGEDEVEDEVEDEEKVNEPVKAPDFELKDLDGNAVKLSDYKGKVVFINFWATWCKYCDKEMPDIQKMYEDYELKRDDFVILAVNVDEDKETVERYIEKGGYEFTVVLDVGGKISRQYGASGLPTTWMIDKEGNAIGYQPGMLTEDIMRQIIENSLGL